MFRWKLHKRPEPDFVSFSTITASAVEGQPLIAQALINCGGLLVSALVGVVLVPTMLKNLGTASYGLWIAMESSAAMFARIDLGLPLAVTREVAATHNGEYGEDLWRFVSTAAWVSVLLGIAGCICMGLLGGPIGGALGISRNRSFPLFLFGGAVLLFDSFREFALAILRGLRSFWVVNAIGGSCAILWGAGAVLLLYRGYGLIALVVWQVLSSAAAGSLAIVVTVKSAKDLNPQLSWPVMACLRGRLSFSLLNQFAKFTSSAFWEFPALIIGAVAGPGAITPYYIARMFPSAVSGIAWRMSEVFFPAASTHNVTAERPASAAVLDLGTRLNVLAMIPIYAVLWIAAPGLLKLWVGSPSGECSHIMRILIVAELFDAASLPATAVLWGFGAAETVLVVDTAILVAGAVACILLVTEMGPAGAAVALTLASAGAAVVYMELAARRCDTNAWRLARSVGTGLGTPLAACITAALSLSWILPAYSWENIIVVSVATAAAYLAVLRCYGARPEERELLLWLQRVPLTAPRWLRIFRDRPDSCQQSPD
jgi:O-antigen/teichoic acid export membrane protein